MQLVSNNLQSEAAMGAVMLGYFLYYYEAWVLPSMMRQEKMAYCWSAAWKKYHNNLWHFNHGYDQQLRLSAISKNLLMEHIHHTPAKQPSDHVAKMLAANKKIFDAFTPSSKRLLIWQVKPSLQ
jgi:hypothetical protein